MVGSAEVIIVGGGVIGLAIAREISSITDDVYLIEKNSSLGDEQSTRNSGVIHAGVNYIDAPLKRKLCIQGNKDLCAFAEKYKIPHAKIGQFIVATNSSDEKTLESILKNTNEQVELVNFSSLQLKKAIPKIKAKSALYAPSAGIIDPTEYIKTLTALAKHNGTEILTSHELKKILPTGEGFQLRIKCQNEEFEIKTKYLINAAGLSADVLTKQIDPNFKFEVQDLRGEFFTYIAKDNNELRTNIYPAPRNYEDKRLEIKDLGVHLTPNISYDGISREIKVGPAIGLAEDYNGKENLFDKDFFFEKVSQYYDLDKSRLIEGYHGNLVANKSGYSDFIIRKNPQHQSCIDLVNIGSPGLTASLAIADYVKKIFMSI